MPLPNFIIVGGPKCGTTALWDFLNQHSDIFLSDPKEPGFFSRTEGVLGSKQSIKTSSAPLYQGYYDRGLSWYLPLFNTAGAASAIGEATTFYIHTEDTPELIKTHVPDAKIIFMLRDPVKRLYSQYWQESRFGFKNDDFPTFDKMIEDDHPRLQLYKEVSHYKGHIKRYKQYFPDTQILIMTAEDLRSSPAALMKTACEFLNVDSSFTFQTQTEINKFAKPKFPALQRALANIGHKIPDGPLRIQTRLRKLKQALPLTSNAEYPKMKPKTRQELIKEFAEDINYVEVILQKDLSTWKS